MVESIYFMLQGAFFNNIGDVLKITIPIYLIILGVKFFSRGKKTIDISRCFSEFIFLGYIVTVLLVTGILSINLIDLTRFKMVPNLIPLVRTIKDLFNYPFEVLQQVLLNIVFFIPFGFLFTMLYIKGERSILKVIRAALLFSSIIEILEYFAGRYMDIDDILWNVIGAIIGGILYNLICNILKKFSKNEIASS